MGRGDRTPARPAVRRGRRARGRGERRTRAQRGDGRAGAARLTHCATPAGRGGPGSSGPPTSRSLTRPPGAPRIGGHEARKRQHGRRDAAAQRPPHPHPGRGGVRHAELDVRGTGRRGLPRGRAAAGRGPRPRRPGRRLRPQLRRLSDRLPRLRPRGTRPRPGQPPSHRRRPGLHRRPVRQRPGARRPRPRRTTPARRTGDGAARQRRLVPDPARRHPAVRRPRTVRRGPGAAALHLRYDGAAQGRDDDAPGPGARVPERRHRPRPAARRPPRARAAAVPLGAAARLPAALPRGRRDQRHPGRAGRGPAVRPDRGRPRGQPVRAAHRVDRPGQPARLRHPGPRRAAQGVLRRLHHARARPGAAARAPAGPRPLQLLRAERDRPARHGPRPRRTRGPAGLLRPARAVRGGAGGR
ncbi:hypothetical protein SGPA1_21112 [Streptomyces misionensis JCM 4497]